MSTGFLIKLWLCFIFRSLQHSQLESEAQEVSDTDAQSACLHASFLRREKSLHMVSDGKYLSVSDTSMATATLKFNHGCVEPISPPQPPQTETLAH